jgi:hypothetical protein
MIAEPVGFTLGLVIIVAAVIGVVWINRGSDDN